ncbi:hypothetical protein ACTXT7_000202 [Hymenolepis weldensis]
MTSLPYPTNRLLFLPFSLYDRACVVHNCPHLPPRYPPPLSFILMYIAFLLSFADNRMTCACVCEYSSNIPLLSFPPLSLNTESSVLAF